MCVEYQSKGKRREESITFSNRQNICICTYIGIIIYYLMAAKSCRKSLEMNASFRLSSRKCFDAGIAENMDGAQEMAERAADWKRELFVC